MANKQKKGVSVFELVCNLAIVAAAILLFVAICVSGTENGVFVFNVLVTIGCGVCMLAALAVVISSVIVLFSKINHRSPEYKNAIVRTVIMGIILVVAAIGFVWALTLLI